MYKNCFFELVLWDAPHFNWEKQILIVRAAEGWESNAFPRPEDLKATRDAENAMQNLFLPGGTSLPEGGATLEPWLSMSPLGSWESAPILVEGSIGAAHNSTIG